MYEAYDIQQKKLHRQLLTPTNMQIYDYAHKNADSMFKTKNV